jgi:hypothetical protein
MYSLIILFAILSQATGAVTPVGVTSQTLAKFKTLDQCKAAANEQSAGGAISDLSLSKANLLALRLRWTKMSTVGTQVANVPSGSAREYR